MSSPAIAVSAIARRRFCVIVYVFLPRAEFSEVIMTHPQVLEHIGEIAAARRQQVGHVELL